MGTVWDCLLAFLATAGLFSLFWLLFGRLLAPAPKTKPCYALIPVTQDVAGVEQQVTHLLWLQGGNLARFVIVLVDTGLNDEGRGQMRALLTREPSIRLIDQKQLPKLLEGE